MMREIDDPRFFLTILRNGSLAAAARALNVTPSAVTQRLQQLEAGFDLRLLERAGKRLQMTSDGELYAEEAEKIVAQYDALLDALRARKTLVRGHLRVHATLGFGRAHIAPAHMAFKQLHPGVEITLQLSDREPVGDHAFDVVVQIGALADSSQVAFPIAPNARYLLATPQYLRRSSAPKTPDDLASHACLLLKQNDEDVGLWRLTDARGQSRAIRVRAALASNDGEVIKQWALAHAGIMMRSQWDSADEIANGSLIRVLAQWKLPDAPVSALVAQRRGLSSRARAFIEFLTARFTPTPPWRNGAT
jgi:DNA-binding transcriptional LysR family regulator